MKIIDYNCLSHTKTYHLEYKVFPVYPGPWKYGSVFVRIRYFCSTVQARRKRSRRQVVYLLVWAAATVGEMVMVESWETELDHWRWEDIRLSAFHCVLSLNLTMKSRYWMSGSGMFHWGSSVGSGGLLGATCQLSCLTSPFCILTSFAFKLTDRHPRLRHWWNWIKTNGI